MSEKVKRELIEWGRAIILAAGIAAIIRTFFFSPYLVEGESMDPTLKDRERLFVNKLYSEEDIRKGDIVIIQDSEQDKKYVKRIIGIPGDVIEMNNNVLSINSKEYKETYLSSNLKKAQQMGVNLTEDFGPITVPVNKYFVMGDNRLNSTDSRNGLGFIDEDTVLGKSEFVVFPLNKIRSTN